MSVHAPFGVASRWPLVPLKRVARLGTGHTPDRKRPELWENCTIPWITTGEVVQMREDRIERIYETRERISALGVENSAAVVHPAGTVVLSRTASAGFSAVMGTDMATSQDYATWTCGPKLRPEYLLWCLRAIRPHLLGQLAMGSTHKTIYMPDLEALRVPLPGIAEQDAVLAAVRSELAEMDAVEAQLLRVRQLVSEHAAVTSAQRVLGTGTPGTPSRYLPFGCVPRGWREARLRDIGCLVQTGPFGSQLHAEDYVEGGWPVINPANISPEGIVPDDAMTVTDRTRAALERHVVRPGDIVFGRRGELGRAGFISDRQAGWLVGTGSMLLRLWSSSALLPEYLFLLLRQPALRFYFQSQSVGSTMDNLNASILLNTPVLVPPTAEQSMIVSEAQRLAAEHHHVLASIDRQTSLLSERRRALITEAVTGKLDLAEVAV